MTGVEAPTRSRRLRALVTRAGAPAIVACAVLAPLAVHWLAGRTLAWFDTQRLYAPQRWLVDEALRAFRLPLWNPFMGGGMPFLADAIHGVLHPVSVLTAWVATARSADVLIGGHVACAGLGAALLARALGASRAGAAVAAFAFGLSGFVLSMAGNLVFLAGAGSLPFCVAGLRRFAVDPRPSTLAFGAGGAAVLALSGEAQSLMVGGVLALVLAWEGGGWRGAARAVAAGSVGLLLAGVQLVPSAVHLPRSLRAAETWTPAPAVWAFEPWRAPELVLPGLLHGPDPYADPVYEALAGPGRSPATAFPMPFAASVFVGLLPLVLAAIGVREGRRGWVLGIVALVLLWIALGPALGASAILGHVPLWRAFQSSEKLVGPLTLVLAALAALGFDRVLERRAGTWQVLATAAVLGMASIGACHLDAAGLASRVASVADERIARGTWHVLGAAGALGGWLLLRDRLGVAGARAALAALAWLGMAAASPTALRPGDPDTRLRAPAAALAAEPPGPRIATPYFHTVYSADPGADLADAAAREHAWLGYPAYNVRARIESLNEYSAMPPRRLAVLAAGDWRHWPAAPRRYAITHVVVDPPLTMAERELYEAVTSGGRRVESVPGRYEVWAVPHRGWATFPRALRAVPDERAALSQAAAALVGEDAPVVVEAWGRFAAAPGRVLSIARGLESLRVEAEADADATLVVADAWWPGWEATVDGVAVPIFRADALVRAVRWPAGRHVLEMRYRPPEVRWGLGVTALGVALTAAWMTFLRRRGAANAPLEHG
ncbi:YfhO family protein [Anaeromyxobacter oryzisoli]|uniref:YfhO family protein n=1 Tax=Anaeromyxobacter oryzisoli TaxID=2925408 RepID=UPI001F56A4BC|nr:YfhO family protein [Anaeromyxobacter sp. SG63]